MELDQLRVALVLAEELHFGRTAQRLHISQSRVSKLVASLEREIGGALFDRTNRRVRLTPLGSRFTERVGPAYRGLLDAADQVAREAQPQLRIGFVPTTGGAVLARVIREFERQYPGTPVRLTQISYSDPYGALRDDLIDVLVFWRTEVDPGIIVGPAIDRQERAAVMAADHPLAGQNSISVLDVKNWGQAINAGPSSLLQDFLPLKATDGAPIPRATFVFESLPELFARIARNQIAHATVSSLAELAHCDDIVFVPISDLPPLDLVLLWWSAHENSTIRNFARVGQRLFTAQ